MLEEGVSTLGFDTQKIRKILSPNKNPAVWDQNLGLIAAGSYGLSVTEYLFENIR